MFAVEPELQREQRPVKRCERTALASITLTAWSEFDWLYQKSRQARL